MGKEKIKIDWDKVREEFETTSATLQQLAEKHNVSPGTVRSRKSREGWEKNEEVTKQELKKKPQKKVTKKATQQKEQKKNVAPSQKKEKLPHDDGKKNNICGAKSKQTGQPCKQPAGWGTDHFGTGRCKLHGGRSPGASKGNKYARTHGAYETIIRDRLTEEEQAVFDAISVDPNMNQEIKILRFKMLRLLDPVEKQIAMGSEFGPEVVTLQVDEVTKAYAIEKLVDGIRKIVKDNKDAIKEEDTVKIIDDVDDVDEMDDAQ